jgi:hypothetical protein
VKGVKVNPPVWTEVLCELEVCLLEVAGYTAAARTHAWRGNWNEVRAMLDTASVWVVRAESVAMREQVHGDAR